MSKESGRPPGRCEERSELLGMEECIDQVDGETAGYDGAKDEVEHLRTSGLVGPAGVERHQPEDRETEGEICTVIHGTSLRSVHGDGARGRRIKTRLGFSGPRIRIS
jgi:hypothetical protein